tara:strand:- start:704 stop:1912 length:1209 start_codon:yes stop_codon:yes gene_type:complete
VAKSYVDSILDAAALASRQDTIGEMLNQLPGLLAEQQRFRAAEEKEAERYAEELTFRNKQYQDSVNARDLAADIELINIGADLEGESGVAYFDNVSLGTEKGRNLGSAIRKSKNISVKNNNLINIKFRDLSNNFDSLTTEEAEKQLSDFQLELDSKGIKRDTSTFEKRLAVKKNREFANDVLDIVEFENEDELRDIIKGSNNPTQIATFMIDRLDKDKLDSIENKKDKDKLMIDLGNVIASLENSGAPESVIKKYQNKLALLSVSSKEGEPVESDGTLTEAEMEAFKSKGQSGTITVPNNDDSRTEKSIRINLDTGEYTYTDDEAPIRDINQELKTKQDELESAKNNPNITKDEYNKLREEVNALKEESNKPKPLTPGQEVEKEIRGEKFRERASRRGSFFF